MNKKNALKMISFCLSGFCAAALSGCGSSVPVDTVNEADTEEVDAVLSDSQELKIDYTSPAGLTVEPATYIAIVAKGLRENIYWDIVRQGAEAAVSDVNDALDYSGDDAVHLTFEGPEEETNEDEQINTLDAVLAENPAALCLAAIDEESCEAQLETARDNEIPVLVLDAGVKSDLVTAVCKTDNVAAGAAGTEQLCEAIGGKGKIALVSHQETTETCTDRVTGFKNTLENYPDVELETEIYQDPDVDMKEQIDQLKKDYPDLDGIFCTNESSSNAVLKSYSDDEDSPVIVGFDNGKTQIDSILSGKEYGCICQNPYSMGYAVVIAALHVVSGEKIDSFIDSGFQWINKDNINDPENQIYLYS